jgi:Lon protease-like protein
LAPIGPLDAQRVLEAETAHDRLVLLAELIEEHALVLEAGDFLQ